MLDCIGEELGETENLSLYLKDRKTRFLSQEQVNALENRFPN